jgi:oligopeptidase A
MMLRQLYFGALDMTLHAAYDPYGKFDTNISQEDDFLWLIIHTAGKKTPFELQRELYDKYTVIRPLPEDRFLCSFSHIFGGGYSAGYYSYKWAEVMSADAFAAFEEQGLNNEEAVKKTGKLFRDTVLSMGGGGVFFLCQRVTIC